LISVLIPLAPNTVALYIAPKIVAMKFVKFKESVHSPNNVSLRKFWVKRRKELGFSQRDLAKKLRVAHPLIGKIETGDRRLDILEVMLYCEALDLDPHEVITFLHNLEELNFNF